MSDYRTLNRTVLAKVESTPGTDSSPVVGTDAILVEAPDTQGNIEAIETDEVTGALDPRAPIPGGGGGGFNCSVNLRGSGAGGTAPEWGTLLRGCAMALTTRAADLTGTAQAGATGSITLAAGATGINVGDIITLDGGTGSGQTRVITAWDNGTKVANVTPNWSVTPDATTTYAVKASNIYAPASTGIANLSIYDYAHSTSGANSRLRKILGAMGDAGFTLPVRGRVVGNFTFQGKFVAPASVSAPGAATYDAQRPVAFQAADIALDGTVTKLNQMSFALGNTVQFADDPADSFGIDVAGITRRRITGRINPPMALPSVRDVYGKFLAGTTVKLWVRYGAANNGLSFYFPQVLYTGEQDEDVNGFLHEGIPFAAQGEDSGVYITVY